MAGESSCHSSLLEAGAEGDLFAEGGEDGFAVFSVAGGEEHAMGFEAAHLAGGEIGDDDDFATDQLFGGVPLGDAGEDLALFVPEVDLEAQELVGLGDAFGDDDFGYAEVDLDEVVDGDLGCCGWLYVVCGDGVGGFGDWVQGCGGGGRGDGRLAELGVRGGGGVEVGVDVGKAGVFDHGFLGYHGFKVFGCGGVGCFHVGHELDESFVCSGEDGGERT